MRIRLAALLLLLLTSCGPDFDKVEQAFREEHPEAVIHELFPGEGDSGNVYIHIHYSQHGQNGEEVWLYQLIEDRWVNTRRSTRDGSWEAVAPDPE
jgi:hypothetical protein